MLTMVSERDGRQGAARPPVASSDPRVLRYTCIQTQVQKTFFITNYVTSAAVVINCYLLVCPGFTSIIDVATAAS